ncbi:putative protein tag-52 isoform X1 [Topomyia yanbarensis]|uniref:putative protein tag-52 isoform X1 n=1 Tax=Topomyia yanbarensis TaxID=2498891 RepID=UPI00273BF696|nr:putative protein tag-52 isoform X1 [Topomyia yanbarensis]
MENNANYLNQKMLKPLMPENMRTELIAALKIQNIQPSRTKSVRNIKKFGFSSSLASPAGQSPGNEENKRMQLRLQAIREIRTSELSYMKQLDLLINYFVNPLKTNGLIQDREHNQIFGQLETIYNLSQELLKKLSDDLDVVVQAFMNLGPFFKLYSVYAFDYRNSLCSLQTLMQKNQAMKKFIINTESRPEVQTKLISLLITPIQRIPRYKLLLQQVLLYTSPSDVAYKQLHESIRLVEQSVSHINSVVEDFENTQRLITIQNALTNKSLKIVKPARKILKEGVLQKLKTDGSTSRKYCILMSDQFAYCKMLKDQEHLFTDNGLECCCIFPLKKCKVVEMFRGSFKITCSGDGIIFTADNQEDSHSWFQTIRDAVELHVQCRKTLRKLSSNRKPMRKKHIQRLEPEDDYLWLLRRKTASPTSPAKSRRSGLCSLRHLDCLKANRSFQDDSIVTGSTLRSPDYLNRRAHVDPKRDETMFCRDSNSPRVQTGRKHVHFQLPASYYRR